MFCHIWAFKRYLYLQHHCSSLLPLPPVVVFPLIEMYTDLLSFISISIHIHSSKISLLSSRLERAHPSPNKDMDISFRKTQQKNLNRGWIKNMKKNKNVAGVQRRGGEKQESDEGVRLIFYFCATSSRGTCARSVFNPKCNLSHCFMQSVYCSSVQTQSLTLTCNSFSGHHQHWE